MRFLIAFLLLLHACAVYAQPDPAFADRCVRHYAAHYGVPAELIEALIDVESA